MILVNILTYSLEHCHCCKMKKKIAILGSTGSIGENTLDIVRNDKKNLKVVLLTANKNYKKR